ncbi:MAG: DNA-packaging protein [Candidatus Pristimantibacillus sp.]
MPINSEVITEMVKTRLSIQDGLTDFMIVSYVGEIEQRILHYCGITEVPEGLRFTWTSMTIDALRIEQAHVPDIGETAGGLVDVSIGDTSTSSGGGNGLTNTSKSVIDSVVLNYKIDLNRYRKLRW